MKVTEILIWNELQNSTTTSRGPICTNIGMIIISCFNILILLPKKKNKHNNSNQQRNSDNKIILGS